jgi:hypothetical protein
LFKEKIKRGKLTEHRVSLSQNTTEGGTEDTEIKGRGRGGGLTIVLKIHGAFTMWFLKSISGKLA